MKTKKDELNMELSSYMGSRNKSESFLLSMFKPRIQISGDVSQESVRKLLESKGITIKNNEQNANETKKIEKTSNTTNTDYASGAKKERYGALFADNNFVQKVNFQDSLNENQSEIGANNSQSSKNEAISKENTKDSFNQKIQAKTYESPGKKYPIDEKSIKDVKSNFENTIGSKESVAEEKLSDTALSSSIKKLKRDINRLLKEKKSIDAKNKYSSDAINLWEITLYLASRLTESDKSALMKSSTYIDFKKKIEMQE